MKHQIRIIAGSVRGRWLYSPEGDTTRPMLGRVKNSLFNIISPHLEEAAVLDLFAGTGALGLEALSRGAKTCIFIEKDEQSFQLLQKNISRLGFDNQSEACYFNAFDIIKFLQQKKFYLDIIFISPPYKFFDDTVMPPVDPPRRTPEKDKLLGIIDEFVKENILSKNGLVIIEHQKRQLKDLSFKYLSRYKQRSYGDIILSFFSPA